LRRNAIRCLGLCGSLRSASLNAALLRTVAQLAPAPYAVQVCGQMSLLPLFNPDLESAPPAAVDLLRADVAQADVLLIASPEYAHGVSSVIKNALDWLVSFESFVDKPVMVLNASPRAHHADDALRETLRTMSARLIEAQSLVIPLLGVVRDEAAMPASSEVRIAIQRLFATLDRHFARVDQTVSALSAAGPVATGTPGSAPHSDHDPS